MQHLEKQAIEHQDREDLVPFTGEKKGGGGRGLGVQARPGRMCVESLLFLGDAAQGLSFRSVCGFGNIFIIANKLRPSLGHGFH